jgi:hypothetical protein|tara:strand:- start:1983 stop:2528 length:546 start_codon:yes stop_codon:yes gene_type:complete
MILRDPLRYPEHQSILKDSRNRYRTMSLFREFYLNEIEPLWSLQDTDPQNELPSLKKLYIEISDPTEYEFAMQAFGSWKHWLKIKNSKAIKVFIEDWPLELEVKLRSEGIKGVIKEAESGKAKFNAAKFLANADWRSTTSKRGRPSKEEVERERKIAAKLDSEFSQDAERIGLHVIKGDKK